jgi:hypothetical protein
MNMRPSVRYRAYEPLSAGQAFFEIFGVGLVDAVGIVASMV